MAETIGKAFVLVEANGLFLPRSLADAMKKAEPTVEKAGESHGEAYSKGMSRSIEKDRRVTKAVEDRLDRIGRSMRRLDDHFKPLSERFGKLFGKGGRNDALNFFGTVVYGLTRMGTIVPRLIGTVSEFGASIAKTFGAMGDKFRAADSAFTGIIAAVGELAATGVPGLIAIASGIAFLVAISGIAASTISALAGALFALGGAITFALGAGLGVLVGLLLPLAAGIATVAFAWKELSDRMDDTGALDDLSDAFKDIQKVAAGGIFRGLKDAMPGLVEGFRTLRPVVAAVSEAIGDIIREFGRFAQAAEVKQFMALFQIAAPTALRGMGSIFIDVMRIVMGLFEAAWPIASRFLDTIEGLTDQFADWLNSVQGQEAAGTFFDRAADSARILWDLIKQVGTAIWELLNAGQGEGNTLIADLSEQVEKFVQFLRENPETVRNWFEQAGDIARAIGRVIRAAIKVFDELDTPRNRRMAEEVFNSIAFAFNLLAKYIRVANRVGDKVAGWIGAAVRAAQRLGGWLADLVGKLQRFNETVKTKFANALDSVVRFFRELPGKINAQLNRISGLISGPLERAAGRFDAFLRNVREIPGKIVDAFRGLAGDILDAIGTIDIGSLIKVPERGSGVPFVPGIAAGGIVRGPTRAWIGEDGPEAVVPLNRPLNQVDPAVRALSAVAQGKVTNLNTWNRNRQVDVGAITIITPTKDPAAVARETVNRLVAQSYLT